MSETAYDPARHDNQVVAMYDTDTQARAARDALVASGVPGTAIQMVARAGDMGMAAGAEGEGMWGAVRSLFVPDDERAAYSHAVGHGHAMLVVTTTAGMDRGNVIHTLEATHPIDFDAKLQEWSSTGVDHSTPHPDYLASTQASQRNSMPTGPTAGGMANSMAADKGTAPMASTAVSDAGFDTRLGSTATPANAPVSPVPAAMAAPREATDEDKIQVIEERLRVGKREVAAGAVRVRSYIVERPVEEQVRLHEEHVTVDRHPVDRAAGTGAFQERTIEARAMSEKAVVTKEARVVEEIELRKEATERTETVRDTVRRTEVEVEDDTMKTGTAQTGTAAKRPLPGV